MLKLKKHKTTIYIINQFKLKCEHENGARKNAKHPVYDYDDSRSGGWRGVADDNDKNEECVVQRYLMSLKTSLFFLDVDGKTSVIKPLK